MSQVYKASKDIYELAKKLIANNESLTPLASIDEEILIVFREKASKSAGVPVLGKTGKATNLLSLVDPEERDWQFVITLAGDEWADLPMSDREALLFHHLSACGVKEKENGELQFFIKPPDIYFYREEVERYGFWRTTGEKPKEDVIRDLFGEKGLREDFT